MNIIVVIVTYNPNISQLKACVASLLPQVEKIIIVKNSDERLDAADFQNEKIVQVQLDGNYGIAYAQNKGVEKAKELNAELLLFSDQDTIYPNNFSVSIKEKIKEYPSKIIYAPVFYKLQLFLSLFSTCICFFMNHILP